MNTAIYPGTFDPVTNGHLDVLVRACRLFDRVIIAVAPSEEKAPLFTLEERLELICDNLPRKLNAEASAFHGLLVDYAHSVGARTIVRGLRAVSDFELEFQMTQMNRRLASDLETIFLMPSQDYFFTSSRLIRQVTRFSGDVGDFVPANVAQALKRKFE